MGTLFEVTAGQLRAFEQHLDQAGFSAEAVRVILREPAKAKKLVAVAEDWLASSGSANLPKTKVAVVKPAWNVMWDGVTKENWLDQLIAREAAVHEVYSTPWQCDLFAETAKNYGREEIQEWERKFLLRFSALPILSLSQEAGFGWWKIKPEDSYYEAVEAGKIGRMKDDEFQPDYEAFKLRGEVVLIDSRLKPAYSDGRQMWQDDELFCGKVLKQLREADSIPRYDHSQKSRFGVAVNSDWRGHIRPALAELIGLEPNQVRLERVIEANAISHFYIDLPHAQDSATDTSVWYEEYFEDTDHWFDGGDSEMGGLAYIGYWSFPDSRWEDRSFRPLTVLSGV